MLQIIKEWLNNNSGQPNPDDLLSTLEECGMLPPKVVGEYDLVPTVTPTGNYDHSWVRKWESEE